MGQCGSRNKGGPGAADRLGAAGSLIDYYDYGQGMGGQGFGGQGLIERQGYGGYGYGNSCPQGVNQNTALLATAAAIAVGAGVIYRAVTLQQAGRRRRSLGGPGDRTLDLLQAGLEEFEEKMDALGQEEEATHGGTAGWIDSLVAEFAAVKKQVEEELAVGEEAGEEVEQEDLEPPDLDLKWGLGVTNSTRSQRSVGEEEAGRGPNGAGEPGPRCVVKVWRCLSGLLEGGVARVDRPGGVMGMVKKALYKVAFHGGLTNIWSSLMTIPEARSVARCIKSHDRCVAEEVVAEAAGARGKGRYLVNPEFLAGGDSSDGTQQFDEYS